MTAKIEQLKKLLSQVRDIEEEFKALPITESWESQVVRDHQRHLKNLELSISDHIISLEAE